MHPAAVAGALAAPVPTVLARAGAAGSRPERASSPEVARLREHAGTEAPDRPTEAVDIQSLTEHVVRQIERRIVAHRERMGRIGGT